MFSDVVTKLIEGQVICPVSDSDAFDWLSSESALNDINDYVSRMGKVVRSPSSGGSFFLCHIDPKATQKPEMRAFHRKIIGDVRPVMDFLSLCMSALGDDGLITPGLDLNAADLGKAIDDDNKLRGDLQSIVAHLPRATGSNDRDRLSSLLSRMEQWGYLRVQNEERQIYRTTGLVSIFYDAVDFWIENTPGAEEFVVEQMKQGELF